jgi:hypothetical protein
MKQQAQAQYAHDVAKFFHDSFQDVIFLAGNSSSESQDVVDSIVDVIDTYKFHPDFPKLEVTMEQAAAGEHDAADTFAAQAVYDFFYNGKTLNDIKKG